MRFGHIAGHFGSDKTIALVDDRFYWLSLKRDVARILSVFKFVNIPDRS